MKKHLLKRLARIFFFSFVWLFLPILVFLFTGTPKSNPYSVSVRGYYRSDGTYVRPYHRRPPGSVNNSEGSFIEDLIVLGMMGVTLVGIGSVAAYVGLTADALVNRKNNYKGYILIKLSEEIKPDFAEFVFKPKNLVNRTISRYSVHKTYNCIYCKRPIGYKEFHLSNLAKRNPKKTCIDCMKKNNSSTYQKELQYVQQFEEKTSEFIGRFEELNRTKFSDITISTEEIENYIYTSIKTLRRKSPRFLTSQSLRSE